MRYIKLFEGFVGVSSFDPEVKDMILAVSEKPDYVGGFSCFHFWQCETMDEERLADLNERLSFIGLEAFDGDSYYENGTEVGRRLIICDEGKVNLIPVDTYGKAVAEMFDKYPSSRFFYSIFDVEWEYNHRKSDVRQVLEIRVSYMPKTGFDVLGSSPSVDATQSKIITKSVYETSHGAPWEFYDQTYIIKADCPILDYINRFGVNEVQDRLGHYLFFTYMDKKGVKPLRTTGWGSLGPY